MYGRQVAEEMARGLAANRVTVVSGLARGVDAIAHRAALEAGGRTIAVLACGLDLVYPPEHKRLAEQIIEQGALISDYAIGTQPRSEFFPRRNRILSGISLGVLVVEGDVKSGALITARQALEQNREVFAVPGSIYSPNSRGTNKLIQDGEAKLTLDVQDVLAELNLTHGGAPDRDDGADARRRDGERAAAAPQRASRRTSTTCGASAACRSRR